jgi:hypothetical protein
LARHQNVRIHPEAHRATSIAPFETGGSEDVGKTFFFGLALHKPRPGHHHRTHALGHLLAINDAGSSPQILDPPVGARSDEHTVY